jgi:nicotinamide-nucleotide amidase
MKAEIISVGDELLIGQVVNTNQAFIAVQLNTVGIFTDTMTTVGDDESKILSAFESALRSHEVVTVTGGLGPTHDDITRAAVCKFFKTDLVQDEQALAHIKEAFAARNVPLIRINEEQALVPRGCTVIQNPVGTAPGYFFDRDGKFFVVMPGVPMEMKAMMEQFVVPFLEKRGTGTIIRHRTLKTTGIAESLLADKIGDVNQIVLPDSGVSLAFLPSPRGTRLRISVRTDSILDANTKLDVVESSLRVKAEKYIYAVGDEELEESVGKLLVEKQLTLAVAESCTGGLIADRITNVPGSSAYFDRAFICYSNESKIAELGVAAKLFERHGAVSREVAEAMAFGARTKSNTDIGISTTGVAGPTGGSEEKPVGLVWIGYSDRAMTFALKFNFGHFGGNVSATERDGRLWVKERASQAALDLLRRKLMKIE